MPQLSLASLQSLLLYLTALFGAFLVALWVGLVFWTYRDLRARTTDRLSPIVAAVTTAILGPAGVVLYLLLRPRATLEEVYQQALEEESLLTGIEAHLTCPGCGTRALPDWQLCPVCHTRLRKACGHCGKMLDFTWKVCPFCASPAPGARPDSPAPAMGALE
jgi:RNA polymerase subunit RPABC4/transcription elongation factor Spt4